MASMKPLLLCLAAATACLAQLPAPNDIGVANGHIHLYVGDPEAQRRFWVDAFGATATKMGRMDVIKLPGVLVVINPAEKREGGRESVINHIGVQVRDLREYRERWKSAGISVEGAPAPDARQVFLTAPNGIAVEVSEEPALPVPVANHHVHFFGPPLEMQAWYVKTFGAKPGKRGKFDAADLPGVNLTFSPAAGNTAGTRGRALDHIGFEVKNLEAFCRKLEAAGVKFDIPYRKNNALALAFLTDPWGTYIELTEGLDGW